MLVWLIAPLFAFSFAGLVWYYLSGIKIKEGWQNGQGPLARWLDERRRRKFNEQLPEALATMSNALRAGFSISQAFDSVVNHGEKPMCEEFAILQQQLRIGMTFEAALQSMSDRVGSDDLTLVTTAILISRKTGGNVTEIFDKISETIRLSQLTVRTIRQNLFWAFCYNVVCIPVAAGIFYTFAGVLLNPMLAGFAMSLSSVSVVTNALRLKGKKI